MPGGRSHLGIVVTKLFNRDEFRFEYLRKVGHGRVLNIRGDF